MNRITLPLLLAGLLGAGLAHAASATHIAASHAWIRVLPGALPAGAYDASALGIDLRFAVPGPGWTLATVTDGSISLRHERSSVVLQRWDAVVDPQADPVGPTDTGVVPDDLVAWLSSHPRLEVLAASPLRLGDETWTSVELAVEDTTRLSDVWVNEGLEGVVRDVLELDPAWIGVYLELVRRVHTDPEFRRRIEERQEAVVPVNRARIEDAQRAGEFRDDLEARELGLFVNLVLNGMALLRASGDERTIGAVALPGYSWLDSIPADASIGVDTSAAQFGGQPYILAYPLFGSDFRHAVHPLPRASAAAFRAAVARHRITHVFVARGRLLDKWSMQARAAGWRASER